MMVRGRVAVGQSPIAFDSSRRMPSMIGDLRGQPDAGLDVGQLHLEVGGQAAGRLLDWSRAGRSSRPGS